MRQAFRRRKADLPAGGHLVPKAPGVSSFDFSHLIRLCASESEAADSAGEESEANSENLLWLNALPDGAAEKIRACRALRPHPLLKQGWDVPVLPCGFVLKLELFSTWGDPHYIGLTGIEIVDAISGPLVVPASAVSAEPKGVCDLEGMEKDVRLPARLTDGQNKADEIAHSWLAPYSEASPNLVCVYVNKPIVLAAIRVWNYAKTPARGAKEVHVYLDDNLVFDGVLRKYEGSTVGEDFHQSVLFTHEDHLVRQEKEYVSEPSEIDPVEVLYTNDNQVVRGRADNRAVKPLGTRPTTSVVGII